MIEFPSNPTASKLEGFLGEVRQRRGQGVRMPIAQRWGGGYGASALSVQCLATWFRQNEAPRQIYLPQTFAENDDSKDRFASTLPGMAAMYFADSVIAGEKSMTRFEALRAVAPRVEAMQQSRFRDTLRGVGIALCCFAGAKNEFLPALYSKEQHGGVRGAAGFQVLLPRLLRELSPGLLESLPDGQLEHLGHLIYELFSNADEHGSFDSNGGEYEYAIRGLVLRVRSIANFQRIVREAGDDNPLKSYLTKAAYLPVSFAAKSTEKFESPEGSGQFLELSVFDTGPGLGLRWLSKEDDAVLTYNQINWEDEVEAVRTCFRKHATTRSLSGSGQGLTQAVSIMRRLKAFMALRTGRVSLYQDFTRQATSGFMGQHRFQSKKLPEIAGTSFTICFRIK